MVYSAKIAQTIYKQLKLQDYKIKQAAKYNNVQQCPKKTKNPLHMSAKCCTFAAKTTETMEKQQISHTCLRCKFSQWETRKADESGKTGKILRCTSNGGKVNPNAIMNCRYWRMGQTLADYFNGNLKGTHRQTISSILHERERVGTL